MLQEQAAKHEQMHGGRNDPFRVTSILILSKLYKHLHDPCSSLHTHLSAGPGSLQADPQGQVQGLGVTLSSSFRGFDSVTFILMMKICSSLPPHHT